MKTSFGSSGSSRLKHNILSVLFVALFLVALTCSIIALVKSPEKAPAKDPSASNTPKEDLPDNPSPPSAGTIKTLSEINTVVTYLDSDGQMPIADVAKKLLEQLITEASNSKETAYTVTKIEWASQPAIFDHTMDTSKVCSAPLTSNVWFVSSKAKLEYTGDLSTDSGNEAFLGGRYIVKSGKNYTLYAQAEYESNAPAELPPAFVWGEYDPATKVAAAEMTLSNGIALGTTYEQAEEKLGGFDSVDRSVARVWTAAKAGYTFTFSLVDSNSTSATDWGLPHDGSYYLTAVEADETCKDEFPRGIKIGDPIASVFTKFPCKNTKLQQWAEQQLYGSDKYVANVALAILQYRTNLGSYRILIQDTGREQIAIIFDKSNNVKGFEWIYQQ